MTAAQASRRRLFQVLMVVHVDYVFIVQQQLIVVVVLLLLQGVGIDSVLGRLFLLIVPVGVSVASDRLAGAAVTDKTVVVIVVHTVPVAACHRAVMGRRRRCLTAPRCPLLCVLVPPVFVGLLLHHLPVAAEPGVIRRYRELLRRGGGSTPSGTIPVVLPIVVGAVVAKPRHGIIVDALPFTAAALLHRNVQLRADGGSDVGLRRPAVGQDQWQAVDVEVGGTAPAITPATTANVPTGAWPAGSPPATATPTHPTYSGPAPRAQPPPEPTAATATAATPAAATATAITAAATTAATAATVATATAATTVADAGTAVAATTTTTATTITVNRQTRGSRWHLQRRTPAGVGSRTSRRQGRRRGPRR